MSTQRGLSDFSTEQPSREALVEDLQHVAEKIDRVPSVTDVECLSEYAVTTFKQEFGGFQKALIASDIVPAPEERDFPDWVLRRLGTDVPNQYLRAVAAGHRTLPDYLDGHHEPVVRSKASSRKRRHAPAVDADEPTPRCELRFRPGGDFVVAEEEAVIPTYTQCDNPGCREWFDVPPQPPAERGLPGSSTSVEDMNGGEN